MVPTTDRSRGASRSIDTIGLDRLARERGISGSAICVRPIDGYSPKSILPQACLKARRHERHVRLQRRSQLERLGRPREIPCRTEVPVAAPLLGSDQFVSRDMERRPLPAIRRLDFDQPIPAGGVEAQDISSRRPSPSTWDT